MEEIELKPCPFCGGKVSLVLCDDEGNLHDEAYALITTTPKWNVMAGQLNARPRTGAMWRNSDGLT